MNKRWKNIDCVIYSFNKSLKKEVPYFGKHDIVTRDLEDGASEQCTRCNLSHWMAKELKNESITE